MRAESCVKRFVSAARELLGASDARDAASRHRPHPDRIPLWSTGFLVAGLVGIALLLASGTFLGIKAKALKLVLEQAASHGPDRPAPAFVPPPLVVMLPIVNTGIVLSVVFDMVTKPASVPVALGVIVAGVTSSAAVAWLRRPAPAVRERLELQKL